MAARVEGPPSHCLVDEPRTLRPGQNQRESQVRSQGKEGDVGSKQALCLEPGQSLSAARLASDWLPSEDGPEGLVLLPVPPMPGLQVGWTMLLGEHWG